MLLLYKKMRNNKQLISFKLIVLLKLIIKTLFCFLYKNLTQKNMKARSLIILNFELYKVIIKAI